MGNKLQSYPGFLKEENEAFRMIRSADWTNHPLGEPREWTPALRISLNNIMFTDLPTVLFWGSEYHCFFNASFLSSLPEEKRQNVTGRTIYDVWPDTGESLLSVHDEIFRKKKQVSRESCLLLDCYHHTDYRPIMDEDGNVAGVVASCKKISSEPMLQKKLKELRNEKEQLLESIVDGFFILDKSWNITYWNQKAEKLLNISQNEVLGKNIWDFFPAEKQLQLESGFQRGIAKKEPGTLEVYYREWGRWFEYHIYPFMEGLSVHFRDISSQRRLQLINQRTEQISGVAGWEFDLTTEKVFITTKGYEIYGLDEGEEISLETNKKLFDEPSLDKIAKAVQQAVERQKPYQIELNLLREDGNRLLCINGFPLARNGRVTKLYGTIEDVTKEKQDKQKLDETIKKLKTAQKIGKIGYWTADLVSGEEEWSAEVCEIYEVDADIFIPNFENWLALVHPEDREKIQLDLNSIFVGNQKYYDFEHRIITPKGHTKWIHARITLHRDENGDPKIIEGIAQDITESKEQEQRILQALQEKEALLEEVHHRVKNNMALISSLVQMQVYEESNDEVREKLMDSVVRIMSMASIHEQLYQSHSFSKLDLSESLKKVAARIVETMEYKKKIILDFKLDQVELNINQAIPCSLVINEVIANVIKHAFKGKSEGNISISLTEKKNRVQISVKDDGFGIPDDFQMRRNKTLGVRLIDTLATQLDAEYSYTPAEDGTDFVIQFEKSDMKGSGSFHFKT